MFSFKVIARSFPAICVVVAAFLFYTGNSQAGWFLILVAFVSFVVALLAKKL